MRTVWFRRFGWVHRPVSWEGAALLLLAVAFCVQIFFAVDRSTTHELVEDARESAGVDVKETRQRLGGHDVGATHHSHGHALKPRDA